MKKLEPVIDNTDLDLDNEVIHVNGRRLTEEFAEEIADEATRISRERSLANLTPGRKSLSGGSKHSPVVQFRVSEATRAALEEIAAARQMSVSKLSRQVIDEFVASQS